MVEFDISANVARYAMPSTFHKVMGIDVRAVSGSGDYVAAMGVGFHMRNDFQGTTGWRIASQHAEDFFRQGESNVAYYTEVTGSTDNIIFMPTPTSAHQARVFFVPSPSGSLNSDSEVIDGAWNGWEEFVVADVAVKLVRKKMMDTSELERDLGRLEERISGMASDRDLAWPSRVVEGRQRYNPWRGWRFRGR